MPRLEVDLTDSEMTQMCEIADALPMARYATLISTLLNCFPLGTPTSDFNTSDLVIVIREKPIRQIS